LALVDGHSLLHRAFFALPPLTTPQGQPTGAVYGFLTMLLRMLDEERPTHLAVAFDRPEPTFRHVEFTAYKAQRAEMPAELRSQVDVLRRVLQVLAIPILEHPGAEADDVIGTLASRAAAAGLSVVVVTGDRDALQLVSPRITVLYTRRGISEIDRMDPDAVLARYGVPPERLVDVKALVGDPSDNYPGVPTVGEKTACRLVATYGPVEDLLARLDAVTPPRVRQALAQHAETVRRNKRLATIQRDVPVPFEPDALRRTAPDPAAVRALCEELGFRSLLPRLLELAGQDGPLPAAAAPAGEAPATPAVVLRRVDAETFTAALTAHTGPVALHAAWAGSAPAALAALLVGADGPVLLWEGPAQAPALPPLSELLAYDSKRLCHLVLAACGDGRPVPPPAFDATIAGYLLDSERSAYPLADLCRQFGVPVPAESDLAGAAAAVAEMRGPAEAALAAHGLATLYREIELPLVPVLAAMERKGVLVDRAALAELERELGRRLVAAEHEIYALAGERFNVNSTQQLARILFERLGLTPPKRTKTGYSTDAEVLEQLAAVHELPARILTYRTLQKLQSTYVQTLPDYIGPDGRIHTDFRQTVAATGRLSSWNPNLQNIPVRDEVGKPLRRVFVAPEGHRLVSADYSQVELRILAHFSGDPGLIEAFREGRDIHRATAAEVFGVPPAEVTPAQRSAAKAVNFGIVYGISDFGLARQLGCDVAEAHAIIARYFERYPGVKRYMESVVAEAREKGVVRTLFGRMRRLPDITSRNFARRGFAERMAMNSPIQGTAADVIKRAMVAAHRHLLERGLQARLILQVHDELVAEVPEDEVPEAAAILARDMEGAAELAVPLRVEVSAGPNWLDQEPVQIP
jgi:DNA polymerase-1